MPKLIVGLGNPGPQYAATRHNVGWMALDAFAAKQNISLNKTGHKGVYGEGRWGNDKLILLKPLTYMNLSGESVAPLAHFYKVDPADILIIYDEMDLPVGKLRLREKGSAGGHNGMKSLIAQLGTQEIPRLRVGIGRPSPGWTVINWVLAPFSGDDAASVALAIPKAVEAIEAFLDGGITKAASKFNP